MRGQCSLGAAVPQARVPIIKFVDAETRIAVDVTFDKCPSLLFRRVARRSFRAAWRRTLCAVLRIARHVSYHIVGHTACTLYATQRVVCWMR